MIKLSSARRYAKTLIELAQEKGLMEKFSTDMSYVKEIVEKVPDLVQFMSSPIVDIEVRKSAVKEIFSKYNIHEYIVNLILLLIDSGKSKLLPHICKFYQDLEDFYLGRVRATVRVPMSLTEEELSLIRQTLEQKLKKKVLLNTEIDTSLVGGIWVKVGDLIFDGTVRKQLQILKENLIKG